MNFKQIYIRNIYVLDNLVRQNIINIYCCIILWPLNQTCFFPNSQCLLILDFSKVWNELNTLKNPPTFFHFKNTNTTCIHTLFLAFQYQNVPLSSHEKSLLKSNPFFNILRNDSIQSLPLFLLIHFFKRPYKAHLIPIKILGPLIS